MDVREKIESVKEYFREVYREARRVTWPSRKDTVKGTYIILVTVVIAALFLGIVDIALAKIIRVLYG
jgi:preprotein translocase subunit SecE